MYECQIKDNNFTQDSTWYCRPPIVPGTVTRSCAQQEPTLISPIILLLQVSSYLCGCTTFRRSCLCCTVRRWTLINPRRTLLLIITIKTCQNSFVRGLLNMTSWVCACLQYDYLNVLFAATRSIVVNANNPSFCVTGHPENVLRAVTVMYLVYDNLIDIFTNTEHDMIISSSSSFYYLRW